MVASPQKVINFDSNLQIKVTITILSSFHQFSKEKMPRRLFGTFMDVGANVKILFEIKPPLKFEIEEILVKM